MAGFWSSFKNLGLENLDDVNLYEEKKKEEAVKKEPPKEIDFLLEKMVQCPVCDEKSPQMTLKTGKAKLLSTDIDLRPRYSNLDVSKYEVYQCEHCGYAALSKYYNHISDKQIQMIKEGICSKVQLKHYEEETYSYERAAERYQLALACAMVKKAKTSEKAYTCMKLAWLMRGYAEQTEADGNAEMAVEIRAAEQEYLEKAYQGFSQAVEKEGFPICGMPEPTIDFLLAALAFELGKYDDAKRMLSKILQSSSANPRAKDKARELKDQILEAEKKR